MKKKIWLLIAECCLILPISFMFLSFFPVFESCCGDLPPLNAIAMIVIPLLLVYIDVRIKLPRILKEGREF